MTSDDLVELVLAETGKDRAFVHRLPSRAGHSSPLPSGISELLANLLRKTGVAELYEQQARAFELAESKRHFVVATRTSSGKSLCYSLPVLQAATTEPAARALLFFPTKALARDQAEKLRAIAPQGVRIGVYDGDTPLSERAAIRRHAHIVVTNPDMVHLSLLPNHHNWRAFLKSLRFVVIDELHVYRGVFGSHVAGVLRRLLRLAEWQGARPVVIGASATIANPAELFADLTDKQAVIVTEDSSPQGSRAVVLLKAPDDESYSPAYQTARLLSILVSKQVRTLAFCRSRIGTEVVLRLARERLAGASAIDAYRGGYTADERRDIEERLFEGRLLGLAATNAMELGVDVGGLDAVVMNGFPGTVTSFWQQSGRAGRSGRDGVAVLVTRQDPLEQSLVAEPELLLDAPVEAATVRFGNPYVLSGQIKCMAHERPVSEDELTKLHPEATNAADALVEAQELVHQPVGYFYPQNRSPADQVNLRGAGTKSVLLRSQGSVLGEMESWRAMREAHVGAVYLHRGQAYLVDDFDLERGLADLHPEEPPYGTRALVQSVVQTTAQITEDGLAALLGLRVTTLVSGFVKLSIEDGSVVGEEDLDMPPDTFDTIGVRWNLQGLGIKEAETVHALEHAFTAVAPLLAGCDAGDLESGWYAMAPETGQAAVYVFDRTPGGVGLAERLMESASLWLQKADGLLRSCPCVSGCPRCLLLSRCPDQNQNLDKPGALVWLSNRGTII